MGITLAAAKPLLQKNLYNAVYNAYMTQISEDPEAGEYNARAKQSLQKAADKFASALSKDMADAVCDFVKEMSITATVTGTITSPAGPCAGAIPPNNFIIT